MPIKDHCVKGKRNGDEKDTALPQVQFSLFRQFIDYIYTRKCCVKEGRCCNGNKGKTWYFFLQEGKHVTSIKE